MVKCIDGLGHPQIQLDRKFWLGQKNSGFVKIQIISQIINSLFRIFFINYMQFQGSFAKQKVLIIAFIFFTISYETTKFYESTKY
jgi:hypothetical protein